MLETQTRRERHRRAVLGQAEPGAGGEAADAGEGEADLLGQSEDRARQRPASAANSSS